MTPALLALALLGAPAEVESSVGARDDASADATAPLEPAPPPETPDAERSFVEAEAGMQLGLTSNLQRARKGGEADGLVHASGEVLAAAVKQRLSGGLAFDLRQPLGLPALRSAQGQLTGTYEAPAGPLRLGVAVAGEYERSLTVFTETGTLGAALSRASLGARAAPFAAWAPEPFRLELAPVVGVRRVTGAETYDLSDLGARVAFRWFETRLFHAGVSALWHQRRFDGLYAHTRDGQRPTTAPAVSLNLLDTELRLGSHPLESVDLALRLGLSRVYDRFDGYHSHTGLSAGFEAGWQPETGLGGHVSTDFSRRTYGLRLTSPTQSGDESELATAAGLHYTVRTWLTPALDYELHFAEAGGRGTLFTEHVGLLGLRGRY